MKLIKIYLLFVMCTFSFCCCIKTPGFPDEPVIEYTGVSKNQIEQNSLNTDSLFIFFSFTDGDGDFGNPPFDFVQNIILTDNRTGEIYDSYKAPTIPELGASKGIEGDITLLVFTTCCIFPENIPPCEAPNDYPTNMISWDIYIMDRSGNKSNVITTDPVTLLCN